MIDINTADIIARARELSSRQEQELAICRNRKERRAALANHRSERRMMARVAWIAQKRDISLSAALAVLRKTTVNNGGRRRRAIASLRGLFASTRGAAT